MNYAYPISFLTHTAKIAGETNFKDKPKYYNQIANIKARNSVFLKFNTNHHSLNGRVGIKFDNISAGKYFVLIHSVMSQELTE